MTAVVSKSLALLYCHSRPYLREFICLLDNGLTEINSSTVLLIDNIEFSPLESVTVNLADSRDDKLLSARLYAARKELVSTVLSQAMLTR